MKYLIFFITITFSCFALNLKAQNFTFTSQAELDAAVFPSQEHGVTLDNDTTLPLNEQIHDLSPLSVIDTLSLYMKNTQVSDCSAISNTEYLYLEIHGTNQLTNLDCINTVAGLTAIHIYNDHSLESINLSSNSETLFDLEIDNCNSLKTIDVDLPNLIIPDNPNRRLEVHINSNDSLQNISIRNPNRVLDYLDVEENRELKELYIDDTYLSHDLSIVFNPKLESIKGYFTDTNYINLNLQFNYMLEDICDLQDNIDFYVNAIEEDNGNVSDWITINQNGPNTSTLQDILDYPCAPASVENNYTVSMGVYPNPTEGLLNIQDLQESTPYKLINLQGQLVQQGMAQPNQPLHLEQLPSGIYFLELEGEKPMKVVKQ